MDSEGSMAPIRTAWLQVPAVFQTARAATDRDGAVKTIEDRSLTLVGPLTFFEGGYGVIVRQPIFVTTDNATDTFGIPDPLNPACGAACDYDPATKEKFWGFVSRAGPFCCEENASGFMLHCMCTKWSIAPVPPDSSPASPYRKHVLLTSPLLSWPVS